jgi:hypothetical protein
MYGQGPGRCGAIANVLVRRRHRRVFGCPGVLCLSLHLTVHDGIGGRAPLNDSWRLMAQLHGQEFHVL